MQGAFVDGHGLAVRVAGFAIQAEIVGRQRFLAPRQQVSFGFRVVFDGQGEAVGGHRFHRDASGCGQQGADGLGGVMILVVQRASRAGCIVEESVEIIGGGRFQPVKARRREQGRPVAVDAARGHSGRAADLVAFFISDAVYGQVLTDERFFGRENQKQVLGTFESKTVADGQFRVGRLDIPVGNSSIRYLGAGGRQAEGVARIGFGIGGFIETVVRDGGGACFRAFRREENIAVIVGYQSEIVRIVGGRRRLHVEEAQGHVAVIGKGVLPAGYQFVGLFARIDDNHVVELDKKRVIGAFVLHGAIHAGLDVADREILVPPGLRAQVLEAEIEVVRHGGVEHVVHVHGRIDVFAVAEEDESVAGDAEMGHDFRPEREVEADGKACLDCRCLAVAWRGQTEGVIGR